MNTQKYYFLLHTVYSKSIDKKFVYYYTERLIRLKTQLFNGDKIMLKTRFESCVPYLFPITNYFLRCYYLKFLLVTIANSEVLYILNTLYSKREKVWYFHINIYIFLRILGHKETRVVQCNDYENGRRQCRGASFRLFAEK